MTKTKEALNLYRSGAALLQSDAPPTQAVEPLRAAVAAFADAQDARMTAHARHALGLAYLRTGQLHDACEAQQLALKGFEAMQELPAQAQVSGHLSRIYNTMGRYGDALEVGRQGLAIADELGQDEHRQALHLQLGNAQFGLGAYGPATTHYETCQAIAQHLGDAQVYALASGALGNVYHACGAFDRALDLYQSALDEATQRNDQRRMTQELAAIGRAHLGLQDAEAAIDVLQKALRLARLAQDPQAELESLGSLAIGASRLGDHAQMHQHLTAQLALAKRCGDLHTSSVALGNLGNLAIEQGNTQQARVYIQEQYDLTVTMNYRLGQAKALSNLATLDIQEQAYTTAEERLLRAAHIWETMRAELDLRDALKVLLFEHQQRTYQHLIELYAGQQRTERALEVAEQSRSRTFVEEVTRRRTSDSAPASLPPKSAADLKALCHAQGTTIVEYFCSYAPAPFQRQSATLSRLYAWVLTPAGHIHMYSLDAPALQALLPGMASTAAPAQTSADPAEPSLIPSPLRDLAHADAQHSPNSLLRELYDILIEPLQAVLPQAPDAQVVIIPHRELYTIPFAALIGPEGRHFIEHYSLRFSPSVSLLDVAPAGPPAQDGEPPTALVVGNPELPATADGWRAALRPLPALPGAEQEAKQVAAMLGVQPLLGAEATINACLTSIGAARYIHFATHGLLEPVASLEAPGALALSPTVTDDGLLTAEQIASLSLHADLVVLSACSTGQGRTSADGVIGLTRAFIVAGAATVVVSLWPVSDAPTAHLMESFYNELRQHGDKCRALQRAMLTTMNTFPAPHAWAGFALFGEGSAPPCS